MSRDVLVIYGASGSGKTAEVNKLDGKYFNIERDKIRFETLRLGDWSKYRQNEFDESLVDFIWKASILRGVTTLPDETVVISDTLCKVSDRRKLNKILVWLGCSVTWKRMDKPLEFCIARDSLRGCFSVGEEVIRRQYNHLNSYKGDL